MTDNKYDIAIIGAGVVGLAIASKLSRRKSRPKIIVLERHPSFGQESSGRNSGVIHAGIYYRKNSLKALLCVEGNRLIYELCGKHNIPFKKTGKYIIAVKESEITLLNDLFKRAEGNGVSGIRFCSSGDIEKYRPFLRCLQAIDSPETGIVDVFALMKYLESDARENNAVFSYNSHVREIHNLSGQYKIGMQNLNITKEIKCNAVINCAGLEADHAAEMTGIDIQKCGYSQYYTKGEYFKVANQKIFPPDKLVYRVREDYKIGTHPVISTNGEITLGPYNYNAAREINYSIGSSNIKTVYDDSVEYLPLLKQEDLSPSHSGFNPRISGYNGDFFIKEESDKNLAGFVNLIGMSSPALTSCLAIADYVGKMIN